MTTTEGHMRLERGRERFAQFAEEQDVMEYPRKRRQPEAKEGILLCHQHQSEVGCLKELPGRWECKQRFAIACKRAEWPHAEEVAAHSGQLVKLAATHSSPETTLLWLWPTFSTVAHDLESWFAHTHSKFHFRNPGFVWATSKDDISGGGGGNVRVHVGSSLSPLKRARWG